MSIRCLPWLPRSTLLLGLLGSFACGSQLAHTRSPWVIEGQASYYARKLAGHRTASGEPYDPTQMTAAHRNLPLGTPVRVTRLPAGPSVDVRINDRCACQHDRIIDLSEAAARKLGMLRLGTVRVRLHVLQP